MHTGFTLRPIILSFYDLLSLLCSAYFLLFQHVIFSCLYCSNTATKICISHAWFGRWSSSAVGFTTSRPVVTLYKVPGKAMMYTASKLRRQSRARSELWAEGSTTKRRKPLLYTILSYPKTSSHNALKFSTNRVSPTHFFPRAGRARGAHHSESAAAMGNKASSPGRASERGARRLHSSITEEDAVSVRSSPSRRSGTSTSNSTNTRSRSSSSRSPPVTRRSRASENSSGSSTISSSNGTHGNGSSNSNSNNGGGGGGDGGGGGGTLGGFNAVGDVYELDFEPEAASRQQAEMSWYQMAKVWQDRYRLFLL